MQHLQDNQHLIIEAFKEKPIMSFIIAIIGLTSGYALNEVHMIQIWKDIFQSFCWIGGGSAGFFSVFIAIKKELIPWIKELRNGKPRQSE